MENQNFYGLTRIFSEDELINEIDNMQENWNIIRLVV